MDTPTDPFFYAERAAEFRDTAQAIQDRLHNQGSSIDADTYDRLEKRRDGLLSEAEKMISKDVQAQLAKLKSVDQPSLKMNTQKLDANVKTLKRFDQVASIASAALNLAIAINTANPGAILTGIEDAEKAIADLSKPSPAPAVATILEIVPKNAPASAGLAIAASAQQPTPGAKSKPGAKPGSQGKKTTGKK